MGSEAVRGDLLKRYEVVEINGVHVSIPPPINLSAVKYVDRQDDVIEKALAAWMTLGSSYPSNLRFYGPSGVGKSTIVKYLARLLKKDLYILRGQAGLRPEHLTCHLVVDSDQKLIYRGSPLFAAMLRGGIFFFDEILKTPLDTLAPLSSVLDDERALFSEQTDIYLEAHKDFLFCAALNENEEEQIMWSDEYEYIRQRTNPAIYVGNPPRRVLEAILRDRFSNVEEIWFKIFLELFREEVLSPRDSIDILKNAYWRACRAGKMTERDIREQLTEVKIEMVTKKSQTEKGKSRKSLTREGKVEEDDIEDESYLQGKDLRN